MQTIWEFLQDEWEVEEIVDSRWHYGRLQYRAAWIGYGPDPQWYPADNFENATELVDEFHTRYPEKLSL